jgi:putative transposase
MPARLVKVTPGQFYHIYNRGNDREPIFFGPWNYRFFLKRFLDYFPPDDVEMHAYCLLMNHYHLLIRIQRDLDYSTRMQHFSISYVKSINRSTGRVGHLFQGRFKAKHVGSTEYLLHLSRYIHCNPVAAGLVKAPEDWQYSSYREYLVDSQNLPQGPHEMLGICARPVVTTDFILSHFAGVNDYRSFVESAFDGCLDKFEEDLRNDGEALESWPASR